MMTLSFVTDALGHLPFETMLDTVEGLGFEAVELACGGWSRAPHVRLDELLESRAARDALQQALRRRGLGISALNCSGHQLAPNPSGEAHKAVVEKTFRLAEKLGVRTIVMMSGCPGGAPGDTTVNWIPSAFLPEHEQMLEWQWNEVFFPYWEKAAALARGCGVEKIAFENHANNLVYNAPTMARMRARIGDLVGMNLDPSHLMWMGGDPIAAARALGPAIHWVHAKDVRLERGVVDVQGLIDTTPMTASARRSWNYVALGHGHDVAWWKEFFTVCRYVGYDGPVSLEMEDVSMDPLTGVKKSLAVLKQALPRDL